MLKLIMKICVLMKILLVFWLPLVDEDKNHTIVDDGIIYLEDLGSKLFLMLSIIARTTQRKN